MLNFFLLEDLGYYPDLSCTLFSLHSNFCWKTHFSPCCLQSSHLLCLSQCMFLGCELRTQAREHTHVLAQWPRCSETSGLSIQEDAVFPTSMGTGRRQSRGHPSQPEQLARTGGAMQCQEVSPPNATNLQGKDCVQCISEPPQSTGGSWWQCGPGLEPFYLGSGREAAAVFKEISWGVTECEHWSDKRSKSEYVHLQQILHKCSASV